jgi:hypothetical protein
MDEKQNRMDLLIGKESEQRSCHHSAVQIVPNKSALRGWLEAAFKVS